MSKTIANKNTSVNPKPIPSKIDIKQPQVQVKTAGANTNTLAAAKSKEDKVIEIETDLGVEFKTLFEVLKDILTDTNIEIIKKDTDKKADNPDNNQEADEEEPEVEKDETTGEKDNQNNIEQKSDSKWGGIRIIAMDNTKTLLIHVKLDADNFTTFHCKKKETNIGVNLGHFYKLIKPLDKSDNLKLYINSDDKQQLMIKVDNPEKNKKSVSKLKLMDLNKKKLIVPKTEIDAVITINTGDFHKICKEMSQIADFIEIRCTKNQLTFTCKGDCIENSTSFDAGDNGVRIRFVTKKADIIQGIFELKYIVMFTKCANICTDIQIYMKNNYPLCINYTVATLGKILFCLSPVAEDIFNKNFDDDDLDKDVDLDDEVEGNDNIGNKDDALYEDEDVKYK
jgi:proliferating cell nuclear antigen